MATTTEAPPTRPEEPGPPPLGVLDTLRWAWRQLTSMRTALVLLFLLALAAIPGSVLPQRSIDPFEVSDFAERHPTLAEWYDRLSLFDVYASPWFAAIYLLLLTSLVGCVVPRSRRYVAAMRARPPAAPRNLERLPASTRWETSLPPAEALEGARGVLRRRRFRTVADGTTVSAERGHLRETGNLLFHIAMLGFLVAVALGSFYGFQGRVVVAEGQGFANAVSQYDEFTPGRFFAPEDLEPFVVTLDEFSATFAQDGEQRGAPRSFDADLTYQSTPTAEPRSYDLRVNHPLVIDGTKVFLVNHGYAPRFTVHDGAGDVVWSGPVPFLQQDGNFTSSGVVKAPDARPRQLGIEGLFLPTATIDPRLGPRSAFPAPRNPGVFLTAYTGDLGLDSGLPQSVYKLEKRNLTQLREDGEPFRTALTPGQTKKLPGSMGSITFEGVDRWVQLDVADDPGRTVALGSAIIALAGLVTTLAIRRRRVWVRVAPGLSGRTVVEVGGLPRSESAGFTEEFDQIGADLRRAVPEEE
ncbi:MAG: cytochrome c biogenesis protein ResB [Actinomycetes bacterium]